MADQNQADTGTPAQGEKALEAVRGEQVGAQQGQVGDGGGQDPGGRDRPGRGRVEVAVAGQGDGLAQGREDVVGERERGVGARGVGCTVRRPCCGAWEASAARVWTTSSYGSRTTVTGGGFGQSSISGLQRALAQL